MPRQCAHAISSTLHIGPTHHCAQCHTHVRAFIVSMRKSVMHHITHTFYNTTCVVVVVVVAHCAFTCVMPCSWIGSCMWWRVGCVRSMFVYNQTTTQTVYEHSKLLYAHNLVM